MKDRRRRHTRGVCVGRVLRWLLQNRQVLLAAVLFAAVSLAVVPLYLFASDTLKHKVGIGSFTSTKTLELHVPCQLAIHPMVLLHKSHHPVHPVARVLAVARECDNNLNITAVVRCGQVEFENDRFRLYGFISSPLVVHTDIIAGLGSAGGVGVGARMEGGDRNGDVLLRSEIPVHWCVEAGGRENVAVGMEVGFQVGRGDGPKAALGTSTVTVFPSHLPRRFWVKSFDSRVPLMGMAVFSETSGGVGMLEEAMKRANIAAHEFVHRTPLELGLPPLLAVHLGNGNVGERGGGGGEGGAFLGDVMRGLIRPMGEGRGVGRVPLVQVRGVVEAAGRGDAAMQEVFGCTSGGLKRGVEECRSHFAFTSGIVRVIVLETPSSVTELTIVRQWLRKELRSPACNSALFRMVLLHASPAAEALDPGEWLHGAGREVEEAREELAPIWEEEVRRKGVGVARCGGQGEEEGEGWGPGVDLVVGGYSKTYARGERNGVVYVTTGGMEGGAHRETVMRWKGLLRQVSIARPHLTWIKATKHHITCTLSITALDKDPSKPALDTAELCRICEQ